MVKNLPANAGDAGSIPGMGRSPGEGNGNSLQGSLSMEFARQEHWSGLPFLPPGNLPDPGIEPASPALAGRFFTTVPPGEPKGRLRK